MKELRVTVDPDRQGTEDTVARREDFPGLRERLSSVVAKEGAKRTLFSASKDGFAGILGGDVRLEEALARLSRAGRQPSSEASAAARRPPPAPLPPGPLPEAPPPYIAPMNAGLRPAITEPEIEMPTAAEAAPVAAREWLPPVPEPLEPEPSGDAAPRAEGALAEAQRKIEEEAHATPVEAIENAVPEPQLPPEPEYEAAPEETTADEGKPTRREYSAQPIAEVKWPHLEPLTGRYTSSSEAAYEDPIVRASELLSPDAGAATAAAFNRLADAIVSRSTGGDQSLEEITRELMRPMLKSWLDEHLPAVVERLVRAEIERVARRGGR